MIGGERYTYNLGMLHWIFFFSGISGLIYQVIWVREFGSIFGNTFQSAALIAGVFVLNLGLGSLLGGLLIDRRHSSDPRAGLKFYAWAEIWIAGLGAALAFIIPWLEILSPAISWYVVGENGWHELSFTSYALRYAAAVILLAPSTLLMGATLTFLIRYVMGRSVQGVGWNVGLLYGFNTLGAAVGCLLVDLALIPQFGLLASQMFAVFFNLLAGVLAFALLRRVPESKSEAGELPGSLIKEFLAQLVPSWTGTAIFISGFAAMGFEIVWFRFLAGALMARREIFSFLLATLLVGLWLGAVIAGRLSRGRTPPAIIYVYSLLGFVITALGGLLAFLHMNRGWSSDLLLGALAERGPWLWLKTVLYFNWPIPLVVFLPAVFMGFAFPVANAMFQKSAHKVGQTAGHIYLWNSMGALLGSLCAGFILLPAFGMQKSFLILAVISLMATVPVVLFQRREMHSPVRVMYYSLAGLLGTLCVFLMVIWFSQYEYRAVIATFTHPPEAKGERTIAVSEGLLESIVISEKSTPEQTYRRLWTNGHSMTATDYLSLRYMRSFAHIPLIQMPAPESALVICFGVGNTLHAVSLHPSMKNIEVADLSKHILAHAGYFAAWNRNVLKDPRVSVFVNDGRQHLRMSAPEKYDLITLEPPPLILAGVSALYSQDFYELAARALKPGGYLTQWWPARQLDFHHSKALVKAFLNVFPNAVLLNGASGDWILMGRKDAPNLFDPMFAKQQIDRRPAVAEDLKSVNMYELTDLVGSFMADAQVLNEVAGDAAALTDNHPVIEYSNAYIFTEFPRNLFQTARAPAWCAKCVTEDGRLVNGLEDLLAYLSLQQAIYNTKQYLRTSPVSTAGEDREIPALVGNALQNPVLRKYDYFRRIYAR